MSEKKQARLVIEGEDRKLVFNMGVLADIEDAGYDPQKLVEEITGKGSTGQLLFLTWLLLAAGKTEGQRDITMEELRNFPPYMRLEMISACLIAVRDGFAMETTEDEARDPVLEEIEKKRDPDA